MQKLTGRLERWAGEPLKVIFILFSLIPIYLTFDLIYTQGVNVPYQEQWDTSLPIVQAINERDLTLPALAAQHNEDRIFFTHLTTAFVTLSTGWNTKVEMMVSLGLAVINQVLLLYLFYRDQPANAWAAAFPFSLLLFSPMQWENWLWGFETQWFYVVMFILLAMLVLRAFPLSWQSLGLASIFAASATFSLSAGLLIWPVTFVGLWLLGSRQWQHYVFWIAAAAICLFLYFNGYVEPPDPGGAAAVSPRVLLHYMVIYVANPFFTGQPEQAESTALILLVMVSSGLLLLNSLYHWWQVRHFRIMVVWWMLAAIAIGSAVTTGLRRAQSGLTQALTARYTTLSILFWIALIALAMLAVQHILQKSPRRWWETGLVYSNLLLMAVLLALFIQASHLNYQIAETEGEIRRYQLGCVEAYPLGADQMCLAGLHPNLIMVANQTLELYQRGLGPFANHRDTHWVALKYFPYEELGEQIGTVYREMNINGKDRIALFQHAPSRLKVPLPADSTAYLSLRSAIYVTTSNVVDYPEIPQDGVTFRIYGVLTDGSELLLYEDTFDPHLSHEPIPFEIDLQLPPKPITALILETDPRATSGYDWSMWVEPMLETSW